MKPFAYGAYSDYGRKQEKKNGKLREELRKKSKPNSI